MHFLCIAFEESTAASDEQRIACEDGFVAAVFEEVADAVLGVAGSVQSFDFDVFADCEGLAVRRRLGHFGAVSAADDGQRVSFELFSLVSREVNECLLS